MPQKVVVIGASNIDLIGVSDDKIIMHDSNLGTVHKVFGGVGRNIAENLGRLKLKPTFITVIGHDHDGRQLLENLRDVEVDVLPIKAASSSYYMAFLDHQGDMVAAINDMKNIEALNQSSLRGFEQNLKNADKIVFDTNIDMETMAYILKFDAPIYIDAISTKKARKIMPYLDRIDTLKCNRYEALVLAECKAEEAMENEILVKNILKRGVKRVFMTVGEKGVFIGEKNEVKHIKAPFVKVINATGAGDAFLSGVIYGDCHHENPAVYGLALAYLTLQDYPSVNPKLNPKTLKKIVRERFTDETNH